MNFNTGNLFAAQRGVGKSLSDGISQVSGAVKKNQDEAKSDKLLQSILEDDAIDHESLFKLAELNPQRARMVAQVFAGRDEEKKAALNKRVSDGLKSTTTLLGIENPQDRNKFLLREAEKANDSGNTKLAQDFMEISQLPFDQQSMELKIRQNEFLPADVFIKNNFTKTQERNSLVKSSKLLPGGLVQQVMNDGSVRVVDASGQAVSNPSQSIMDAEQRGVDLQTQKTRTNNDIRVNAEEAKATGKQRGKSKEVRVQGFIDDGIVAAESIPIIKRSLDLMESVRTSGLDSAMLRAKQMFGVEGADEAELSANLGRAVLAQLKPTFGAQFTEKEGKRLERIESGFGKSVEGNKRLLKQLMKILDREARRGISAARKTNDQFSVDEIEGLLSFELADPAAETPKTPAAQGGEVKFLGFE